jgi:eukaryotic-like serine/threonine-protein kinase
MPRTSKPLTADILQEELRFLLKTLLRDDLFGAQVLLTEAEKLLESALSLPFVEYAAFLKRNAFIDIDRMKNTIQVLPRGKSVAEGSSDPSLHASVSTHFARALQAGMPSSGVGGETSPAMRPPVTRTPQPAVPVGGVGMSAAASVLDRERYTRGALLGAGSLGQVIAATDSLLGRDVVMKEVRHVFEFVSYLPKDEIIDRVRGAVMAQARLDHPHILRVLDLDFRPEGPTIVLDRAVESLADRLRRGPMAVPVVLRMLVQICNALHFAHQHGVVHGGIKPENILIDVNGNVRVADFGLSKVTERPMDLQTSAPPVYMGRGNPSYMSPEQLHRGLITAAGDVYSLGILLYEMLTGNLPGRRSPMPSSSERIKKALAERVGALDELFDRMTMDSLTDRYPDMNAVLTAIYQGFSKDDVFVQGTLLLFAQDPSPPPNESRHEVTNVTKQAMPEPA